MWNVAVDGIPLKWCTQNWYNTYGLREKKDKVLLYVFRFLSGIIWAMRNPVFAVCEQQRRRSACASAQADQRLYFSLPRWYTASSFYIRNFKALARFWSWAGRFESYLVENPEDRFSHDEPHKYILNKWLKKEQTVFLQSVFRTNHFNSWARQSPAADFGAMTCPLVSNQYLVDFEVFQEHHNEIILTKVSLLCVYFDGKKTADRR